MDDQIYEIKAELRNDFNNPFYEVAKAIVDPMVKKLWQADWDGLSFPEEYPEPMTWGEAFNLSWHWGLTMQHEADIRPFLRECRRLML